MNDYKELVEQLNGACIVKVVMKDMTKADLFARAADAIEQLVKERDAAVADLKTVAHRHNLCDCCKHCTVPNGDDCDYGDDCEWEWRGVQRADT